MLPVAKVSLKIHAPYSVLITDDDEECRTTVQSILEPGGYRTYLASNGYEAIQVSRNVRIHVAILDIHMPGMTGLETWQRIREEGSRRLPCVFMTGDVGYAEELRSILKEPACAVVKKPLSKAALISTLESLIRRFAGEAGYG